MTGVNNSRARRGHLHLVRGIRGQSRSSANAWSRNSRCGGAPAARTYCRADPHPRVLNDTLTDDYRRWYPRLHPHRPPRPNRITFPRFVPLSDQAVILIRHHPPGLHTPRSPVGSFVATSGQNGGHQWAGFMAATGRNPWSLTRLFKPSCLPMRFELPQTGLLSLFGLSDHEDTPHRGSCPALVGLPRMSVRLSRPDGRVLVADLRRSDANTTDHSG